MRDLIRDSECHPTEYVYERPTHGGQIERYSIDLFAEQWLLGLNRVVGYFGEAKYSTDGTVWVFTPSLIFDEGSGRAEPSRAAFNVLLPLTQDGFEFDHQVASEFLRSHPVCEAGTQIKDKNEDRGRIDKALRQVDWAVAHKTTEVISAQIARIGGVGAGQTGYGDFAYMVISMIVTTASLWAVRQGTTLEDVRSSKQLEDIADGVKALVVKRPPEPDVKEYTRSQVESALETHGDRAVMRRLFEIHQDDLPRIYSMREPCHFIVHYGAFSDFLSNVRELIGLRTLVSTRSERQGGAREINTPSFAARKVLGPCHDSSPRRVVSGRRDLLRQRRALREAGRDPDAARVRRPEVVEGYEQ